MTCFRSLILFLPWIINNYLISILHLLYQVVTFQTRICHRECSKTIVICFERYTISTSASTKIAVNNLLWVFTRSIEQQNGPGMDAAGNYYIDSSARFIQLAITNPDFTVTHYVLYSVKRFLQKSVTMYNEFYPIIENKQKEQKYFYISFSVFIYFSVVFCRVN